MCSCGSAVIQHTAKTTGNKASEIQLTICDPVSYQRLSKVGMLLQKRGLVGRLRVGKALSRCTEGHSFRSGCDSAHFNHLGSSWADSILPRVSSAAVQLLQRHQWLCLIVRNVAKTAAASAPLSSLCELTRTTALLVHHCQLDTPLLAQSAITFCVQ